MTNGFDVLKHSVTRDDYADTPYGGNGIFNIFLPQYGSSAAPDLLPYWSQQRDFQLRGTIHMEAMWASAVNKAITKIAARDGVISDTGGDNLRAARAQKVWKSLGITGRSKSLRDFLLVDNGVIVEVVYETSNAASRLRGLVPLDSCRCTRTSNPEIPVLYRSRKGTVHEIKAHQVIMFADMPDPSETYNGVGFCAASRAYPTIAKLAALERYVFEKLSGNRALALHFIQGLSSKSLNDAIITAEAEQIRRGSVAYKGAIVVPVMSDTGITVVSVPLAELPDGFDAKQLQDNGYVIYANSLGVAVQDIQPLSGQGLGTGTQSVILDESAEWQGIVIFGKQWEEHFGDLLPETTTFAFSTNDIRDQKAKADAALVRAQTRATQVQSREITPQIARQMAVDANDVPREFLATDQTPGAQLSDNEKPITETQVSPEAGVFSSPGDVSIPAMKASQAEVEASCYDPDPSRVWHSTKEDGHIEIVTPDQLQGTQILASTKASKAEVNALLDDELAAALDLVTKVLDKQ